MTAAEFRRGTLNAPACCPYRVGEDGLALHQTTRQGRPSIRRLVMAWFYLLIASVFEVAWAVGLKYADGFSRLWPSAFTVACMIASVVFLSLALKTLPVGTGYAVWTGLGAVGTVVAGIVLFAEPATALRLASLAAIVARIARIQVVGSHGIGK